MGVEILTTGKVNVLRLDREELLDIRNGKWEYDKLVDYAEKLQDDVALIYDKSDLPRSVDYNKINKLLQEITEGFLNE